MITILLNVTYELVADDLRVLPNKYNMGVTSDFAVNEAVR